MKSPNNYLIANSQGLFYRGTAYGDDRDWTSDKETIHGAFYYTLDIAWQKICQFPVMFGKCEVLRID
jgi:hypothetical protein